MVILNNNLLLIRYREMLPLKFNFEESLNSKMKKHSKMSWHSILKNIFKKNFTSVVCKFLIKTSFTELGYSYI